MHPQNLRGRWLVVFLLAALIYGSLLTTAGYAWYLRSALHRQQCAELLSSALGLPADIGRIIPRARDATEFGEVTVWLPDRRDIALHAEQAILQSRPSAADPAAYEIIAIGGVVEISPRTWLAEEYRTFLERGLRPGLTAGGPDKIVFSDMNVRLEREGLEIELGACGGTLTFEQLGAGTAEAMALRLNDYLLPEPVILTAAFSATDAVRIDRLAVQVPTVPFGALKLGADSGVSPQHGRFAGLVHYHEEPTGFRIRVGGRCTGLEIGEWSAAFLGEVWSGRCPEMELRTLEIREGRPSRIDFRGAIEGLRLEEILRSYGLTDIGGRLDLRIAAADVDAGGIRRLIATGSCRELNLGRLTAHLDQGRMTGTLNIDIRDLQVEENRLVHLEAIVTVPNEDPRPHSIEARLIQNLLAGNPLMRMIAGRLPERISYRDLGLRLEVVDEQLLVFGETGPNDEVMVTLSAPGWGEIPIREISHRARDLTPLLDAARAALRDMLRRHWSPARPTPSPSGP